MQIVINIPEQMYINAKADMLCAASVIARAIKNGTPLPKGHGRLIDENKITKFEQTGLVIKDDNVIRCLVTDAPTIIDAN